MGPKSRQVRVARAQTSAPAQESTPSEGQASLGNSSVVGGPTRRRRWGWLDNPGPSLRPLASLINSVWRPDRHPLWSAVMVLGFVFWLTLLIFSLTRISGHG